MSCKVKLSCQKSSQLPTAVTRVSEPLLFCCFPSVWGRSLILNRALSFPPDPESPTPRAVTRAISYQNRGAMWVESQRLCPTVTLTLKSFLLLIFPLGFPLLQSAATWPATLTMKSRLCSAVCTLPGKLEVRHPNLRQGAEVVRQKAVAKALAGFVFFSCNTHVYFKFILWVFDPHGQVFMQKETINPTVHKFYLNDSRSSSWGPAHVPGSQRHLTSGSWAVICLQNQ